MTKPIIEELKKLPKGSDTDSKIIMAVSPLSLNIMVPKAQDQSYSVIARITWLCKDIDGNFFCLTSSYVSESDDDDEFLVLSPLSAERYYTNYNLTSDLLSSSLPHYLTDFEFKFKYPDNLHRTNETEISCQAFERNEEDPSKDKLHKIMVTPEIYSTLAFVDSYMMEGIKNNGDLNSALVFGADENNNTMIFEVNIIEIEDAAIHNKNNLVVKAKLFHTGKSSSVIECMILLGSDFKKSELKKEIKKNSFEKISDEYMSNDENQFISRFLFEDNISESSDDSIAFIKAVNMNKDGILLAFKPDILEVFNNKVKDFILNK